MRHAFRLGLVMSLGAAFALSTALAGSRTALTRFSQTGRVIVLDDGVEVADFGIGSITIQAVALTKDGTQLYVLDSNPGELSRVDLALQRVTDTITVAEQARRVALNSTDSRAYVTDLFGDKVSIVDTATFTVIHSAPLERPRGVLVGPNDQFIYVSQDSINDPDGISKLSALDGTLIASIAPFSPFTQPGDMALSHDGSELYLSQELGGLVRIDLATFTMTQLESLPHKPTAIVLHPSGFPLYVGSWEDDALMTLDPETFEVLDVIEFSVRVAGIDITPDGQTLYAHTFGDTVFVVDTATNSVIDEIDLGGPQMGFGDFITEIGDDVPTVSGAGLLIHVAMMLGLLGLWLGCGRARSRSERLQ